MSIKKELLETLTEQQLKELAGNKGINFKMNKTRKRYYADWDEKDRIVDMMSDKEDLTVREIEKFIEQQNKP